jgi:ATP-dependent DNA helicase RecG
LTGSQVKAVAEIEADLGSLLLMRRLLQGPVGSGKTVVALFAAALIIDGGGQAVLLAPTTLLVEQHFAVLQSYDKAGFRIRLLTGSTSTRDRAELLTDLAAGNIDLLVATHAVFSDDVQFRQLRLLICDEQQRWGIEQRQKLLAYGDVDILEMTATPIPRSLKLVQDGRYSVSELPEMPPGRLPVLTSVIPLERLSAAIAFARQIIDRGGRVYWVCTLIDQNDLIPATAAKVRYERLRAELGDIVELVHGRVNADEQAKIVERFVSGATKLLCTTTLVELGLDVGDATLMVIEHAERFGLAQLHQLRGRVGRRPNLQAYCVAIYAQPLSATASARLMAFRVTNDSFRIAEEDLRLRGEGDVLTGGERQAGLQEGKFFRFPEHEHLVEPARIEAEKIISSDPTLTGPRGPTLRWLLKLFGHAAP